MNNMIFFKDFQNRKHLNESIVTITNDGDFLITPTVLVPKSLVNGFMNKMKNNGQDVSGLYAPATIADTIVSYIIDNNLTIENLPTDMLNTKGTIQTQAQVQAQPGVVQDPQAQMPPAQPAVQAQAPAQPVAQAPAQPAPSVQQTAAEIPPAQAAAQTPAQTI